MGLLGLNPLVSQGAFVLYPTGLLRGSSRFLATQLAFRCGLGSLCLAVGGGLTGLVSLQLTMTRTAGVRETQV